MMEVILLERIEKLGQMGDIVSVKSRLCPQLLVATGKGIACKRRKPFEVRRHEGAAGSG